VTASFTPQEPAGTLYGFVMALREYAEYHENCVTHSISTMCSCGLEVWLRTIDEFMEPEFDVQVITHSDDDVWEWGDS
jgi:hypothetical protein